MWVLTSISSLIIGFLFFILIPVIANYPKAIELRRKEEEQRQKQINERLIGFNYYNYDKDRWYSLRWSNTAQGRKAMNKKRKELQKDNRPLTAIDLFKN